MSGSLRCATKNKTAKFDKYFYLVTVPLRKIAELSKSV